MDVKEETQTTRLVAARPVSRPEEFVQAVASLSGATPIVEGMRGFLGRNDNWLVPTAEGPDLFVKRLRGDRAHAAARMDRVLAFQRLIAGRATAELRVPAFHGADAGECLLVFEYVPDSRAASDLLAAGELDVELAHRMGRVLGEVHSLPRAEDLPESADDRRANAFYALSPEDYANCSGGEVEAWALLQHDKVLVEALAALHRVSAAAPATVTHGDLRLDQFLCSGDDLYVIDWEEFRHHDPARDVGAFAGEFVHHAVARMFRELDLDTGLSPGAAHEAIVAAGDRHLSAVREHIRRFWQGYREVAEPDEGLAVRATGYIGWHFFDRLLAGAVHGARLSAVERGMAGIGRNALTTPEKFAPTIGLGEN
ncbi:class V lanthionine synthetase subunit LxmK [Herbidospora yilanensis]|uniref:class V lanthionine synthetase subunit LxmK n=1 Tax=Herbidospora yilanensis TaxID=354426 RepID=UPI000784CFA2|nr:class V lanthionine synthetase subunit LxmK [Herbidospora yilanensis]